MNPSPDTRRVVALAIPTKTDGSVVEVVCTGGRAFGHAPPGAPVRWYTVDATGTWRLGTRGGWVPVRPPGPVVRAYTGVTPLTRVPVLPPGPPPVTRRPASPTRHPAPASRVKLPAARPASRTRQHTLR